MVGEIAQSNRLCELSQEKGIRESQNELNCEE